MLDVWQIQVLFSGTFWDFLWGEGNTFDLHLTEPTNGEPTELEEMLTGWPVNVEEFYAQDVC